MNEPGAYDRAREKAYIQSQIDRDRDLSRELREMYERALHQINDDLARFIGRYATEQGIRYDDALLRAAKTDVEALAHKARDYVADRDFSDEANEMLRRYNLKMRMSRAEILKIEMELELIALGDEEMKTVGAYLDAQFVREVKRQAGILGLTTPSQEALLNQTRTVVDSSWKGATWSQRIWKNNEDLRARLGIGLRSTMMQGTNPREWARRLQDVLRKETISKNGRDNAIFRSERLAITEAGRVQIEAQLRSYDEAGHDELEVITEPGACPHCLLHDGEIVKLSEARMGENIPMFHPFCRCSTAAHMRREALEREFEAHGFARMSEQEIEDAWQNEQKRRADLKEEQLDRIIRLDATQHDRFERYADTLKELAVSPEQFSKMQRFGGKQWETLKYQYRTLNRYEIPDEVSASTVLALDEVAWKSKQTGFESGALNSKQRYSFRESGNAAAMLTDGAFYFSHSQIGDLNAKEAKAFRGEAELVGNPKEHLFETKDLGDGLNRKYDTEYKLLSHLATMHEPDDIFSATILSERHICESCAFVLEQFREAFPASTVQVISGKLGYNGDEKGNKTWKYRRRPKRE